MSSPAIPEKRHGLWASLKEAVHGSRQDFTEGSISRAVFLLATPMVLEMVMESLFAIVNVFWVTRLGPESVAAVGLTESMLTLVFAVAFGVSMSTTAMVARRIGEKDPQGAATAGGQALLLGVGFALLTGLPAYLMAPQFLAWMGASPTLIEIGRTYCAIVLGSNVVVMLLFLNNGIFRGAGDASIAMRVLWLSNLINLVLDPCLIFGLGPFPELGLTGAAISTLFGRGTGVVYQLYILFGGKARVRLLLSDLRVVPAVFLSLVRVSSTGVLQFVLGHASWILLVRIISEFGSLALAGYTIAIRIFIFAILPSWGLSGAAATMVGQNLGAKKPDRAVRAVYLTGFYNTLFLGAVSIVFVTMPEMIVRLFTTDPEISKYAVDCLRIVGYGNAIYGFGMVLVQAFNGAGDTVTPTLINVFGYWLCEIPLAWMLAFPLGMGGRGVFVSIPVAQLFITLLSFAMFLKGDWKRQKI